MKKISLIVLAVVVLCSASFYSFTTISKTSVNLETSSNVVFRSNQYLYEGNGGDGKIYLYSSGECEMYRNDYLEVECKYDYRSSTNELHLLDENGRTVVTGRIYFKRDGRNVQRLVLRGTTYYAK